MKIAFHLVMQDVLVYYFHQEEEEEEELEDLDVETDTVESA